MERIIDKLDKMDEKLDVVDKHLAIYNEQLKDHIRRTELLEEELKPVVRHVNMVQGSGKLISIISVALGIILLLSKLIK